MKSQGKQILVLLLLIILIVTQVARVDAAKGIPGSPEFGFGVTLYPNGPMLDKALYLMADLHPDWLYVPVSWAASSPSADAQPDLAALNQAMAAAAEQKIAVVLSLSDAPAWALTPDGPDPQHTAQFAALLVQRYPGTVQALELFPRANTLTGWGSAPNPPAYLALYRTVQQHLAAAGSPVLLVGAGLQLQDAFVSEQSPFNGIDALVYLQGLYDAGGKDILQVISLQYADTNPDLLISPLETDRVVFRHYETIRAQMLANGHTDGIIWVTDFGLRSAVNGQDLTDPQNLAQQNQMLRQGYSQLLSQLYVGTAILQSLNPAPSESANRAASMLQPDESLHTFYPVLKEITQANNDGGAFQKPGRAKDGSLAKQR